MYINKGGQLYNFCPAKATWDHGSVDLYRMLIVTAETKQFLYSGGIYDQPDWFIDLISWFLPTYDQQKFISRARMVLGDKQTTKHAPGKGPTLKSRK